MTEKEKNAIEQMSNAVKEFEEKLNYRENIINFLISCGVTEKEARTFMNGMDSSEVTLMLYNFISGVLKPILSFPDDVLMGILRNHDKADEIILAIMNTVNKSKELGNSVDTMGKFLNGELKDDISQ